MSRPFHNRKRRGRGNIGNRVIRRYPYLGKFEGQDVTALYAYSIVQDGLCDEEESFGDGGGWYGKVDGPFEPATLKRRYDEFSFLNRAERRFIAKQVGCVLYEDSQGFFNCTWYDDPDELAKSWQRVTDFFDRYCGENDDIEAEDDIL